MNLWERAVLTPQVRHADMFRPLGSVLHAPEFAALRSAEGQAALDDAERAAWAEIWARGEALMAAPPLPAA